MEEKETDRIEEQEVDTAEENAPEPEKKGRRLSKETIAVIVIVSVLVVAFAVFLPIFLRSGKDRRELYRENKIQLTIDGKDTVYTIEEILALDGVEEEEFPAVYDTSISDRFERTYTGFELKKLLKAVGVSLAEIRRVRFMASDGCERIYKAEDVLKDGNVYVAYKVNGKPFNEGIRELPDEQEDGGPLVVIRASDQFSQDRCKLLVGITVE